MIKGLLKEKLWLCKHDITPAIEDIEFNFSEFDEFATLKGESISKSMKKRNDDFMEVCLARK